MPEQDLPPWLSRVTFDQADGLQTTGIVQLPLTYAGPSIPLAWPWTSVNGQGEVLVSLLGGTGFQTLPETTLTAVISTEAPQETQASPAPTAPFVTTDDTGQQITIPGVISTLPDGSETIVPASPTATPAPPATAYLTETDSDGQPTATVPGVVSSITAESGDTLTTIPATESTLENGQTTLIPITRVAPSATDQRQPVTTTATLDGTPTTATGFLSTLPDGSTTAIFSSLSSLSNSDSDSDSSSTSDASSSTTESSMSSSISSSSEPSSSGASDSDNGLSDGQLAGIIVGSIVFALFLAALCALCCCFRRRRQRRHGSDTGWTMVTNGSAGHQRLSDRTEDEEEEDIDIDPRQLFMLPPAEYEGFGQQPMREVERESGSSRSGSTGRSFGLLPPSRFSNRHSQGPRPMASYHTVATTE